MAERETVVGVLLTVAECEALARLARQADTTAGDLASKFIRDGIQRATGQPIAATAPDQEGA